MKNNHIVVLTGKSAAGKDFIQSILEKQHNYKAVISTTTRPIRTNEIEDVNYYYKTKDEFEELIKNNKLIEHRYYDTIQNGKSTRWHYGIEKKEIDLSKGSYIAVVDMKGLEDLKKEFEENIISFYIDVDAESRRTRAMARDNKFELQEWKRRFKDDDIKFKNVHTKVDYIVENYDLKKCIDKILWGIENKLKMKEFFTQYTSY